jgi:2-alkenal reductase
MQTTFSRIALIIVAAVIALIVLRPDIEYAVRTATSGPRPVEARAPFTDADNLGIRIFEADSPSVVQVVSQTGGSPFAAPFAGPGIPGSGTGSGFIWDDAGHVVTNNHVVQNARTVAVRLPSGEVAPAEVRGVAPTYDLAVLRITTRTPLPPPLPLGSSDELRVGQAAFAIGNPFGLQGTMTSGIISALERRLPTSGGREIAGVIQTDASINPGNSGGPLLDSAGRVIGVTTAILSPSGTNAGIGFAIPVDVVNRVVPELIRNGRVPIPGIGVSIADESVTAGAMVEEGVVVVSVVPGSPAASAGLRGIDPARGTTGDIIVAANGRPVRLSSDLTDVLETTGVGNSITLTVVNGGNRRDVSVRVVDITQG